ncbi:hypothetical protein [Listeria monocytogenes]|uniref:hypothetical protein n=1 Tax=Listeria monocytogenes TaxID=1639 RepID=UPI000775D44A|nr:hypothetical protein [Listeria monocytogenes]KXS66179.1 hypothetical protein AWI94_14500 [Listeria monocytogenes]
MRRGAYCGTDHRERAAHGPGAVSQRHSAAAFRQRRTREQEAGFAGGVEVSVDGRPIDGSPPR